MLIAVVSAKGSPGVSTLALGLTARWPGGPGVLVEADPAGGDLAARFGLFHDPGLATMALAGRDSTVVPQPASWVQRLPCGVEVILAPPGAAAAASLATVAGRGADLLRLLAAQSSVVIVDAGRWQPGSPADPLLAAAEVVLLVTRPAPDELRQADARLPGLRQLTKQVRLVLAGERGPWPPGEIARALAAPVAGVLPVDRTGAGLLSGRLAPRRGWRSKSWLHQPLLASSHSLARALVAQAVPPPPTMAGPVVLAPPPVAVVQPPVPPGQANGKAIRR